MSERFIWYAPIENCFSSTQALFYRRQKASLTCAPHCSSTPDKGRTPSWLGHNAWRHEGEATTAKQTSTLRSTPAFHAYSDVQDLQPGTAAKGTQGYSAAQGSSS